MSGCKSPLGLSERLDRIDQDKNTEFLSCPMPVQSPAFFLKTKNYNLDSLAKLQWEIQANLERVVNQLLKADHNGSDTQ